MLVNYVPRVPNAADFAYNNGGFPICVDDRNGNVYVLLAGVAPYNVIQKVAGGGADVVGPASSTDSHVAFFDGATGKLLKDSGLTLSGSNTGDQTSIVGITGTLAQFNTALTGADFATGGGTATGTNTGDQTNISGNAATVTTNANLTGHVTSVGNAAVLGSFTSAQLLAALTDETGSGAAVFATNPSLTLNSYNPGTWTVPAYSGGDYTSDTGSWTVDSGDVVAMAYSIINKTMHVNFILAATTVTGTPSKLKIVVPAGKSGARVQAGQITKYQGTWGPGTYEINGTSIDLYAAQDFGATLWAAGSNNTYIRGSIAFEIS